MLGSATLSSFNSCATNDSHLCPRAVRFVPKLSQLLGITTDSKVIFTDKISATVTISN